MDDLKDFTISFVGLKLGKHQFEYEINDTFFSFFDYDEFNSINAKVDLCLNKKANMLELDFKVSGSVNVPCDLTNEPFDQPIDGNLFLVVKFGDEYEEIDEELVILPRGEYEIEVQQYVYETIVLSIPQKRIHPKVKDGTMDSKVLKKLEELRPKAEGEKKDDDEVDPRWNKLKELLDNKK